MQIVKHSDQEQDLLFEKRFHNNFSIILHKDTRILKVYGLLVPKKFSIFLGIKVRKVAVPTNRSHNVKANKFSCV